MKTSELKGAALQHAVMLAEGWAYFPASPGQCAYYRRGEHWTLGGAISTEADDIIDREGITTIRCDDDYEVDEEEFTTDIRIPVWAAALGQRNLGEIHGPQGDHWGCAYSVDEGDVVYGATRREAAMRAWAVKKLGPEINVPEGL